VSSLCPIHCEQWIYSKSSEIIWHLAYKDIFCCREHCNGASNISYLNLLDLPVSLRSSAMLLKDSYVYLVWSFPKMLVHGNLSKGTSSAQAFYSWYFCTPEQNPILKYGYSRLGSWYQSDLSKGTYTFVGSHNWLLSPPRPYLTRFLSPWHLPDKCVYRLCLTYMRGSWSPNLFHFSKQNIPGKFN
jgi:hypothetical protein